MQDIEDYLTKKYAANQRFNTFNYNHENINKSVILLNSLLEWINDNPYNKHNDKYNKMFEIEYNKQVRLSKIKDLRKSILINVLNIIDKSKHLSLNSFDNNNNLELLKLFLRKRPARNLSGVTVITVITAPFPNGQTFSCKHDCFYCPNEPAHSGNNYQAQPRSYLFWEPAVQRANRWNFEAIQQMFDRMDSYSANGHTIDKLEIIVEGGTYTEYPVDYLETYHRDLFYAANVYLDVKLAQHNSCISQISQIMESIRQAKSVEKEIEINKTAKSHIIGICIETRPDALDDDWLMRFRKWGVTRVQIGIQHTDNAILRKINRGHTIEKALWAMQYLKDNCFKIDIHIMPDLPGSSPEKDKEMFDFVYSQVCPDQMKIYPCQVVSWTKISEWYKKGIYKPYFDDNPEYLINVVKYAMETCPNYIRLPRVIRDIPIITYVDGGNNIANMRQVVDNMLNGEGVASKEIRSREIGRHCKYYNKPANYNIYKYHANNGIDYFIAYESYDKVALFGFIRLRIVNPKLSLQVIPVLFGCGLVRELHVYGDVQEVGSIKKEAAQHKGIGSGLLRIAEKISMQHGLRQICVISGEGVKGYYEKRGYVEKETFMIKKFWWFSVLWYYILSWLG